MTSNRLSLIAWGSVFNWKLDMVLEGILMFNLYPLTDCLDASLPIWALGGCSNSDSF